MKEEVLTNVKPLKRGNAIFRKSLHRIFPKKRWLSSVCSTDLLLLHEIWWKQIIWVTQENITELNIIVPSQPPLSPDFTPSIFVSNHCNVFKAKQFINCEDIINDTECFFVSKYEGSKIVKKTYIIDIEGKYFMNYTS